MIAAAKTRLPQLELDCLRVLWKHPGASVAEVRAALGRPLAYTTVMTVLDRMSAKGVVDRRKNGRAYSYSPVLDVESARQEAVARLLVNLFENDCEALVSYVARFRGKEPSHASPRTVTRRPAKKQRAAASGSTFAPSRIDDSLL
ncbi:MAG: BlaI/MecI/CopY family transcriptional regulator [Acidobacteriia bacterium]|nr:BlaI/MecI/CopY family transcriptional regulator [Terriglobia bacterium]